jgi:hypothetical protein
MGLQIVPYQLIGDQLGKYGGRWNRTSLPCWSATNRATNFAGYVGCPSTIRTTGTAGLNRKRLRNSMNTAAVMLPLRQHEAQLSVHVSIMACAFHRTNRAQQRSRNFNKSTTRRQGGQLASVTPRRGGF